jgi:hypothetical protein
MILNSDAQQVLDARRCRNRFRREGTARLGFEDFDNNAALSGSFVTYKFAAAPAATPELGTLLLFATGVAGVVQRVRRKQR